MDPRESKEDPTMIVGAVIGFLSFLQKEALTLTVEFLELAHP